jgi:tyrosyl-tRNA synthetase
MLIQNKLMLLRTDRILARFSFYEKYVKVLHLSFKKKCFMTKNKIGFEEQVKILKRGVAEIVPEHDFLSKLQKSLQEGKPLRVKLGIDPTAPDIHLGHSVVLRKLRQFQELGHKVILIIGDFTARIGDPTGRSETRKVLSQEEIEENTKTYLNQIGKIVNIHDRQHFELRYNSEWLSKLSFADVVALAHHFTVAQLLEREDFAKRYENGKAIGLHEFFYPIMQGYDSVAIQSDVELGGTDQKFNILVGRDLQRLFGANEPQTAFLLPILEGIDGVQKMSKSLGNYIGIAESPDDMFGKVMRIPDSLMPRYFELLTDVELEEINRLKKALLTVAADSEQTTGKPSISSENQKNVFDFRAWKARLAEEIVAVYYGRETAQKAWENFDRIHRDRLTPEEMEVFHVSQALFQNGRLSMSRLLVSAKLASSRREALRLIESKAVEFDNQIVQEDLVLIPPKKEIVLKVGKRRFIKLLLLENPG